MDRWMEGGREGWCSPGCSTCDEFVPFAVLRFFFSTCFSFIPHLSVPLSFLILGDRVMGGRRQGDERWCPPHHLIFIPLQPSISDGFSLVLTFCIPPLKPFPNRSQSQMVLGGCGSCSPLWRAFHLLPQTHQHSSFHIECIRGEASALQVASRSKRSGVKIETLMDDF